MRRIATLLLLGVAAIGFAMPVVGWTGPAPLDWERLPITDQVGRVDTPASGALFARTTAGLQRSNDGGMTWTDVPLPPAPAVGQPIQDAVVVDPTDHSVLYAAGRDGLYRSMGEPVSWSLILPLSVPVLRVSVSPADPSILYAAAAQGSGSFQIWRSDDRGGNWNRILGPANGAVCGWVVPVLTPQPHEPDRIFGSWRCHAGREVPGGGLLRLSTNRGVTWMDVFRRGSFFPQRVVGGSLAAPDRFYMLANRGAEPGGGFVARSDDFGLTWTDVYTRSTSPGLGGLAMDPSQPDHLYIGLADAGGTVLESSDAGASWSPLGSTPVGAVRDLALGSDGAFLYAATSSGLWRYRLGSASARA